MGEEAALGPSKRGQPHLDSPWLSQSLGRRRNSGPLPPSAAFCVWDPSCDERKKLQAARSRASGPTSEWREGPAHSPIWVLSSLLRVSAAPSPKKLPMGHPQGPACPHNPWKDLSSGNHQSSDGLTSPAGLGADSGCCVLKPTGLTPVSLSCGGRHHEMWGGCIRHLADPQGKPPSSEEPQAAPLPQAGLMGPPGISDVK